MASLPRKLLSPALTVTVTFHKPPCPPFKCFNLCDCVKSPPLPADVPVSPDHHLLPTSMTVMACLLGVFFIMGIVFTIARLSYRRRIQSRSTPNPPILFHTHDEFADEDLAGGHPHPIWLINFVGLNQSVIDSITVCKYRSGEGLIEGTECSVCLSEFEEDESLRLLPKCSHAFHLPCIDTWLSSHQNCPLCRAPIVSARVASPETEAVVSVEETQLERSGFEDARTEVDGIGDVGCDQIRRNGDSRALSDLGGERRMGLEVEAMRRSVSTGSMVRRNSSDCGQVRRPSFKKSGTKRLYGLVKSASFVQKKPVSMKIMKRSCSSRNCRSRSQDSVLSL